MTELQEPNPIEESDPIVFKHACKLYQAMWDESNLTEWEGNIAQIWKGSVVELYESVGISKTHYSPIYRGLERMGCISRLEKGTAIAPSVYSLHAAPTLAAWSALRRLNLTKRGDMDILSRQIREITEMIGGLNIAQALGAMQVTLDSLAARVRKLEEISVSNTNQTPH